MTHDEILAQYSTPGLRKQELTRDAKKDHLGSLKVQRDERDKILSALFGSTDSELYVAEQGPPPDRLVTITGHMSGNTVTIKPTIEVQQHGEKNT